MTNINTNDHLAQTINLMHSTQGYPMIVLKNYEEQSGEKWMICHYLAVNVAQNEFVIYRFMAGNGKDNWLTRVETTKASFAQMLNDYTAKVLTSQYTTLEILPC